MNIPKARDLEFYEVHSGNAPSFTCSMCGDKVPVPGFLMADIRINDDDTFKIVACDRQCAENFKTHPYADTYIRNQIKTLHGY